MQAAVRRFSWILFLRAPLAEEEAEISAAVATLRRRSGWLLVGYLVFVATLVIPGLLRDRGTAYHVTAIVAPHLLLCMVAMSVAYSWVGFRINLGNLSTCLPQLRRSHSLRSYVLPAAILALGGFGVGFLLARVAGGRGLGTFSKPLHEVHLWFTDTFTVDRMFVLAAIAIVALPELIARLRLRERRFAERAYAAEAATERTARRTAERELRLLQAQIEPHFLFNTLASVRYLVQAGSPDALPLTDALIDYLRAAVPAMRAGHGDLGSEVDLASSYLDIMCFRMPGRLQVQIEVPASLRSVPLPPLVLLTLVENAITHGLAPLIEGGSVAIAAREDAATVVVEVRDSGRGPGLADPAAEAALRAAGARVSTGTGLANARERLQLTFGEGARLELLPNHPRGTIARVTIPRDAKVQ